MWAWIDTASLKVAPCSYHPLAFSSLLWDHFTYNVFPVHTGNTLLLMYFLYTPHMYMYTGTPKLPQQPNSNFKVVSQWTQTVKQMGQTRSTFNSDGVHPLPHFFLWLVLANNYGLSSFVSRPQQNSSVFMLTRQLLRDTIRTVDLVSRTMPCGP